MNIESRTIALILSIIILSVIPLAILFHALVLHFTTKGILSKEKAIKYSIVSLIIFVISLSIAIILTIR